MAPNYARFIGVPSFDLVFISKITKINGLDEYIFLKGFVLFHRTQYQFWQIDLFCDYAITVDASQMLLLENIQALQNGCKIEFREGIFDLAVKFRFLPKWFIINEI